VFGKKVDGKNIWTEEGEKIIGKSEVVPVLK
jgi:hypothetical protein